MWKLSEPNGNTEDVFMRFPQTEYYRRKYVAYDAGNRTVECQGEETDSGGHCAFSCREGCGFRPLRKGGIKLESEAMAGQDWRKVIAVHNYG